MKKYIVISIAILTLGFVSCEKMLNYAQTVRFLLRMH
jgi:hypothetical protein